VNETDIEDHTVDLDRGNAIDRNIEQNRNLQQMNGPLLQVSRCSSSIFIKYDVLYTFIMN